MKALLAVPNISEGRNLELIEAIVQPIRDSKSVQLIDCSSDSDHHRTVITYIGPPEAILEVTQQITLKAVDSIDMSKHKGSHPRQGAVDVVPFIPIRNVFAEEAVDIAKQFGRFVGSLGIPVYYYEDAATKPERVNLVKVRKGEYEALPNKLRDPEWVPDEGPCEFNAKSGATQVAARFPLIALNVNLRTANQEIALNIAKAIRHINGGYRFVRAIGLTLEKEGMVQVSMNLTNYYKTPIPRVMESIRSEAARYGVSVAGSELVGPVPIGALEEVVKHYLQAHSFSMDQIIENALIS